LQAEACSPNVRYSVDALRRRLRDQAHGNPTSTANLEMDVARDAATGHLKPTIRVINPHAMTAAADAIFATIANEAGFVRPPDVKATKPPSMEETIELFHLSNKQALAFRIIADILLAEKNAVSSTPWDGNTAFA